MDIVMTALLPCCRHVLRVGAHDQPVLACTLMCDDSYTRVAPAKFFGVGVKPNRGSYPKGLRETVKTGRHGGG